ncbi:hypothetical protein Ahy_A10g049239 [Arachis hypogaea]|uniref:Replication factor A C-terminal domain-containing protein n=1 Tax=Arachis hypogaea TaxID=3818 RepID=A0A445B6W7_ARAHY|nr:hypothetical protein Ahy_A10g049239 [Arachis hypogaea]
MNSLKRYQRPPVIKVNGGEELAMLHMSQFDLYGIASNHFSRLHSNEVGDLDGQFFVVGKIKEIVEDPEIKILVEDGTSSGMFVLLDNPATKLLGRTCSDVFLLLEDEIDVWFIHLYFIVVYFMNNTDTVHSFFTNSLEKKLFSKFKQRGLPLRVIVAHLKSSMSLVMQRFFNKLQADQCVKDQICFLTGEIIDVLKHQKWWYYCCLCNAPVSHVGNVFYCYLCRVECVDAIRRYRIKINIFHSNGSNIFILDDDEVMQVLKKSCSDFLIDERKSSQSTDDYTVPNGIISQLMNKKIVFIVDPRPVGYELNTSLHVVRAVCDDVEITVNYDFHARISSSQGLNLFGNHQPLTIREELRSAFGQYENTIEAVERMDECSG